MTISLAVLCVYSEFLSSLVNSSIILSYSAFSYLSWFTLLILLVSSFERIWCFCWFAIALLDIITYGVLTGFWKYEWFKVLSCSCHSLKSSVGNCSFLNSSGVSTVNSRSVLIEFIAVIQILAILSLLDSPFSLFLLSSILASCVTSNFLVSTLNLLPNGRLEVSCLPSSTYPASNKICTSEFSRIFLYSVAQFCMTISDAAPVHLSPIDPPSSW